MRKDESKIDSKTGQQPSLKERTSSIGGRSNISFERKPSSKDIITCRTTCKEIIGPINLR